MCPWARDSTLARVQAKHAPNPSSIPNNSWSPKYHWLQPWRSPGHSEAAQVTQVFLGP